MPRVSNVFADAKDFVVSLFLHTVQGRSVPRVSNVFADVKDSVVSLFLDNIIIFKGFCHFSCFYIDTFRIKKCLETVKQQNPLK